ncbi:uncharacterized protein [Montipora capricornis]|uniref:uncharacterized protein isoform X1 n=1 Tax=Montipora capricornis TaxID=246305 RepID=UPI0035F1A9BE
MTTKTRTYGRGILRFTSWEPCRLPGHIKTSACQTHLAEQSDHVNSAKTVAMQITSVNGVPVEPVQNGDKPVKLLAKYNYKANPDRPGGFDELTITQGENLEFCRAHPTNPHWWEARNGSGNVGFVPATYMMVLENKISALPWLEERKQQRTEEEKRESGGKFGEPVFKPYKSAYGNNNDKNCSSENFYCDICGKDLNGPIPYNMHLNSKAHKEEVALREEFNL